MGPLILLNTICRLWTNLETYNDNKKPDLSSMRHPVQQHLQVRKTCHLRSFDENPYIVMSHSLMSMKYIGMLFGRMDIHVEIALFWNRALKDTCIDAQSFKNLTVSFRDLLR